MSLDQDSLILPENSTRQGKLCTRRNEIEGFHHRVVLVDIDGQNWAEYLFLNNLISRITRLYNGRLNEVTGTVITATATEDGQRRRLLGVLHITTNSVVCLVVNHGGQEGVILEWRAQLELASQIKETFFDLKKDERVIITVRRMT